MKLTGPMAQLVKRDKRSLDLYLDAYDVPGHDRAWLRRQVFTGHVYDLDPKCLAANNRGLTCWRDWLALRAGAVGSVIALITVLLILFMAGTGRADLVAVGSGVGITAVFTGLGALIGNWLDYHVPSVSLHSDGSVVIGKRPSTDGDSKVLWKRAIEAAEQGDREELFLDIYLDGKLAEIHSGLRALDEAKLTKLERKQMERWVRVAVQHLEDEVSRAMIQRVGMTKEIAPLPERPQLVEWTPTGTPVAEQELDHAEELR